jgi:hypothetical protein
VGGRRLIVLVCLAAALVAAAPTDARKKPDPCRPKHASTVFDNGTVRYFHVSLAEGVSEYLCVWSSRRRFFLTHSDIPEENNEVRDFATRGRFFLYVTKRCTKEFCNPGTVGLINFRSGTRKRLPIPDPASMVLTAAGSVAYTTDPPVSSASPGRGVYLLRRSSGQPEQLDAGDDIDPRSLALAGHTLYWTRAGQPRSAYVP